MGPLQTNAIPLVGGVLTLVSGPTQLMETTSVNNVPCRQLVMRIEPTALGIVYYGNKDVSASTAVGYFYAREAAGFGPLSIGCGIYPSSIYLLGNAGTRVYWWAFAT
jgi:hypothetical protein